MFKNTSMHNLTKNEHIAKKVKMMKIVEFSDNVEIYEGLEFSTF